MSKCWLLACSDPKFHVFDPKVFWPGGHWDHQPNQPSHYPARKCRAPNVLSFKEVPSPLSWWLGGLHSVRWSVGERASAVSFCLPGTCCAWQRTLFFNAAATSCRASSVTIFSFGESLWTTATRTSFSVQSTNVAFCILCPQVSKAVVMDIAPEEAHTPEAVRLERCCEACILCRIRTACNTFGTS